MTWLIVLSAYLGGAVASAVVAHIHEGGDEPSRAIIMVGVLWPLIAAIALTAAAVRSWQ